MTTELNISQILQSLPHRYPFLLVDRVQEYTIMQHIVAIKNVSINEPFFSGHFPNRPVMPGVLILEALAQTAGILAFVSTPDRTEHSMLYFAGIDNARFKKVVEPGDQLILRAEIIRVHREIWKFNCIAKVDNQLVCQAQILAARREQ